MLFYMRLKSISFMATVGVFLAAALLIAGDHPAEVAEVKLAKARADYAISEKRFLACVADVSDVGKREATLKAFQERKASWVKLDDADAMLRISASPLPDSSTNSSLIPYWTEVHYLELQSAQLKEDAEWIEQSWK